MLEAHGYPPSDEDISITSSRFVPSFVEDQEQTTPITQIHKEFTPQKKSIAQRTDLYLRRSETPLAKVLNAVAPSKGTEYSQSKTKRLLDISVGLSAGVATLPVVAAFGVAKKLEDREDMLFRQPRIGKDNPYLVTKLRTMRAAKEGEEDEVAQARGKKPHEHHRNTRLGSFMRKTGIDELPQLWQVVKGEMSVVGVRPMAQPFMDEVEDRTSRERFARFEETYKNTPHGITGANQVFGARRNIEEARYHFDAFYEKHASLGFDIYLMGRTIAKTLKFLK